MIGVCSYGLADCQNWAPEVYTRVRHHLIYSAVADPDNFSCGSGSFFCPRLRIMLPDLKYVIKSLLGWKLFNDVEQLSKTDNDKVELHFLSHYMCSSIYAMYKKKQNPVPEKAESGSRKSRIQIIETN